MPTILSSLMSPPPLSRSGYWNLEASTQKGRRPPYLMQLAGSRSQRKAAAAQDRMDSRKLPRRNRRVAGSRGWKTVRASKQTREIDGTGRVQRPFWCGVVWCGGQLWWNWKEGRKEGAGPRKEEIVGIEASRGTYGYDGDGALSFFRLPLTRCAVSPGYLHGVVGSRFAWWATCPHAVRLINASR